VSDHIAEKDAGLRDRIQQVADAYLRSWQRTPGASTLDTDVAQMLRNLLVENHPAWSEYRAENDAAADALEEAAHVLDRPDTLPDLDVRTAAHVVAWLRDRADTIRVTPPEASAS